MAEPIQVAFEHRARPLSLDAAFTLDAPWTALFAPSGAGKTTILRMIAGLDAPQTGHILAGASNVLLDTRKGVSIPAHQRKIRMVTQRAALFPHLSVLKNLQYGMQHKTAAATSEILELCRIPHLCEKLPHQLSGGERQRVALARALAAEPCRLLLLDEPFTGLEGELRDALIHDLRQWTQERGVPVLLVTHDLGEVFAAEAKVLKMEGGRIVASGSAAEVLSAERERLIERLRP